MSRLGRGSSVFILATTLVVVTAHAALAYPGQLDASFSGDGMAATNFTSGDDFAWDVAIQSDGMIVAAGRAGGSGGRFALVRYEPDGDLDTTFGGDGKVNTNFTSGSDTATSVGIQSDGKIVAAGAVGGSGGRFGVARYDTGGVLDTTFGGDGKVTTNFTTSDDFVWDLGIQSDGAIVAAGVAGGSGGRFALVRYNANGTLDTTFGGDGKVTTNFTSGFDGAFGVGIQSDGKILATGRDGGSGGRFALARYTTSGILDTTFSADGKVTTNFGSGDDLATSMAIQTDGKIVAVGAAGSGDGQFAAARYDTAGTLDSTYSGDGKFTWDFSDGGEFMWDVAIQPDEKIVVAGFIEDGAFMLLARLNTNGELDSTFGCCGEGREHTNFTSGIDIATAVSLQSDGKIVVGARVGGSGGRFGVARYLVA